MALVCYAGDTDSGERAIAPFRRLAEPAADLVRPMAYPEIYELGPEPPPPTHEAARSFFLEDVDATAAEAIVEHIRASTAPMAVAQLRVLGGAIARVPAEATAFAHRDRRIMAAIGAVWENGEESPVHEAWVRGFAAALQGGPGVYVNFVGEDGSDRVREAYPGGTWDRLALIKAQYDPTNLFRLNQNIEPRR
jgi:FAD/FMN-containing dehydrogenase